MNVGIKQNKKKIGLLAIGLSVALSLPAYAAEDDPVFQFAEVVVTASGYEQDIVDAPASITVITKEELNRRGYTDLADILADVEGVDVRSSAHRFGVSSISIRGMGSEYTMTMVDGIPQNADKDLTGQGGGYAAGLSSFVPPLASIERIEIIRGPMSTLYGSNAMGGVVNIITKKVADEWRHNLTTDYTLYSDEGRGSITRYSLYSSGPLVEDKVGLALRGNFLRRGASSNYNDQSGGGLVAFRNYGVGGKVTWKLDDSNSLWLDLETATSNFGKTPTTNMRGNKFSFVRDRYVLGSENKASYGDWTTTLSYDTTEFKGYSGGTRKLQNDNLSFETKLVAPVGDAHTVTVGGRYLDSELFDTSLAEELGTDTLNAYTAALFVEDDWRLREDLTLTYGARYEHHNFFSGHVSPRGYLVWKADDRWTLKGGVSTGYKTPSLRESTPGNTGSRGGGLGNDATQIYGNPNLKPEKSVNKEVGFYYQAPGGIGANLTLFKTDFKDKIQSVAFIPDDYDPALDYSTYENVDRAKVKGIELGTKIPLAQDLALNLNYTYTESEVTAGESAGYRLTDTPKHAVNARLNWQANEKTAVWLRAEHRGKMLRYNSVLGRNETEETRQEVIDRLGKNLKAYTVLDLGVSRKLSDDVTMNFSINNLLDKDFGKTAVINGVTYYEYFTSRGTFMAGRNYWVSLSYNF